MRRSKGFTLVELMIVVSIIAVLASAAVPSLLSARISANEAAAISTLRSLISAQSMVKTDATIDQDQDGQGEYAWFGEMAGTVALRTAAGPLTGPVLSPATIAKSLGLVNANGVVTKSGYVFRCSMPTGGGAPISEAAGGGSPAGEDPDLCEQTWVCYAWPASYAHSGKRAFAVNVTGELIQCDNLSGVAGTYSGIAVVPTPDAAIESGSAGNITGNFSVNGFPALAVDGNTWRPIN